MKVGLKDTLILLSKGYSKKDIDALIAEDEKEPEKDPEPEKAPDKEPEKDPEPEKEETPDFKALYDEIKAKNDELEKKIKELQADNRNANSLPDMEKAKQEEEESLLNMVKTYM